MFAPAAALRRGVCLAVFILLCVLPTLYLAYLAVTIRSPAHAAEIAAHLRTWLDLEVELGGVTYPRPGIVEYRDLLLLEPESGRRVARIDRMRLSGRPPRLQITATEATLFTSARRTAQSSIDASQTSRVGATAGTAPSVAADPGVIWETFARLLGRLGRSGIAAVDFACAELSVDSSGQLYRLSDVAAWYQTDPPGAATRVRFRLADLQMAVPSELEIRRDRIEGTTATRVVLHTGPTPLPMKLLDSYFNTEDWLGPRARFQGTVWFDESGGGWEGGAEGRLAGADLDSAVSRRFPHRLSGTADLQIDRFRWADGRMQHVAGSLRAGPGLVSGGLLHALAQNVGFELGEGVPLRGQIPYRRLGCSFVMESGQLAVAGRCQDASADAVMVGDTVLLRQPPLAAEIAGLVRALVPPIGVSVPVNLVTHTLLRRLPMPGQRRSVRGPTEADTPREEAPERLPPQLADPVLPQDSTMPELPPLQVP